MTTKLGIYLDVNTVNWTLFNAQDNHLIDAGVHVFRQGCENFGKPFNAIVLREKFIQPQRLKKGKL